MQILLDSLANREGYFDSKPNMCPVCHHAIEPKKITYYQFFTGEFPQLRIVWGCPRNECNEVFISYYESYTTDEEDGLEEYSLYKIVPLIIKNQTFPKSITMVSPDFINIYNQAFHADTIGLGQICGPGYRKALEYLIKDYASSLDPDNKNRIQTLQLAKVITDFVPDPNIKKCASRAAWLGNDEVHYIRKWQNKDIRDLKILINLTVNWIDSEIITREYEASMPDK